MTKTSSLRRARVTLLDVAAAAEVDTSTVSRVLRGASQRVSEETRARILRVAADLGYVANANARSLVSSETMTLGLLIPNIAGFVYSDVIRGAVSAARDAGYVLVVIDASEIGNTNEAFHRLVLEGRVDGLLIASGTVTDTLTEEMLRQSGRCIILNRLIESSQPSIIEDDEAGMRLGVEELIRLGHRRISCISGPRDVDTARRRLAGYRSAMESAGLSLEDSAVVHAGYEESDGYAGMLDLLRNGDPPTGVAVVSLAAAIGALAACAEKGIRVPDDLSIVAFHDAPIAAYLSPPLTTVSMPLYQLGQRGTELLVRLLKGDDIPSTSKVTQPPPRLVMRASTAAPRDSAQS